MDTPIKIMHVLRPAIGGMRQHLTGLVNLLNSEQVETVVVCSQGEGRFRPEELPGVKIVSLDIKGGFNLKSDWEVSQEILRIAQAEKVSVIHAHGIKAGFLCLWASLNRHRRFAVICTFHNQFRKTANPVKNTLNKLLVATIANQTDHVITVSQAIQRQLVEYLKVYPFKITCIYNGIDLAKFNQPVDHNSLRQEFGIPHTGILIGTVARLIPQKGISVLIKAAAGLHARNPELYFVVIGDGPFREALELEAAGAGLRKVMFFTGHRTNIQELLANLDIFVLPTLEEGFSIVTLEAMAVKKPVVVSKVGGLPEVVSPETGLTVPPANPEALDAALRELISNPAKRIEMGNAASERVKSHFSLTKMVQQHLDLYHGLVSHLKK